MKYTFLMALYAMCSVGVQAQNPFITHKFIADPSAHVFNDRVYVYASHDEDDAEYYDMVDWACFSSSDLATWVDHGAVLSLSELSWADKWAWAPDAAQRNGLYYLYYPVERNKIGVAVSDRPEGPFEDPLDQPIIDGLVEPFAGKEAIDPAVFIDDDGQAYLYFGCREPRVTKLKDNMIERDGELMEVVILDQMGRRQVWHEKPKEAKNVQANYGGDGVYGEGPWVFERNGIYYFTYANGWSIDATMVYAISDNPLGPFVYQGKVMEPVSSNTSHGSIIEYKGQWYVFYHTKDISGKNYRRSVAVDQLFFDEKGQIKTVAPTRTGVSAVRN
ncbi:family 43 glycosylhydrolase [Reichenbachiella carrageenanivorans]|uniref:Family 43 glycosylhydrolase n=1 Tax=Reichenbachiella carrageenanivorans TaxID=2979869 RepID=A0ABY6D7P2_9BACT|nr:family 43 glycosylhydrolase [Reichenbachiella carrageenanivorans]UXX81088.1 family 43 glycosylhydrolase [Reichenbachiella carrageenanivorans]